MLKKYFKKNGFVLSSALLLAALSVAGCSKNDARLNAEHDHPANGLTSQDLHEGHVHEPGSDHAPSPPLSLTEKQAERIHLRLAEASPGALSKKLGFPGEIRLDQDSFIQLIPRVSGVINEVLATRGDRVKKGQVLAVMESPVIGELKASFLDAGREARFNRADLDRFTMIQENTHELIRFLESEPPLGDLENEDFGDMSDYGSGLIRAYADLSVTKKALERQKNLFEKRITSQKAFLEAQGTFERSRAEYLAQLANTLFSLEQEMMSLSETYQASLFSMKAAERQLGILGLTEEEILKFSRSVKPDSGGAETDYRGQDLTRVLVRAPRDGNIIERSVGPGEKVDADTTIFTMAELRQVWACLQVPSRDLALVEIGQQVTITAESGEETTGTVAVFGPLVNGETRTAELRVVVRNHNGQWMPGLFIRGSVSLPGTEEGVVIPRDALQVLDGEEVVFVPEGVGFITVPVTTGRTDKNSVEITSGLQPGMRYVAQGAFELKSIMITGSLDPHAGHGH